MVSLLDGYINLSIAESLVMLATVLCSLWMLAYGVHYFNIHPGTLVASDYGIYRAAGKRQFHPDWIYKNWLGWIFYPLSLFNPVNGYIAWGGLNLLVYIFLIHRMSLIPGGLILSAMCIPFFCMHLQCGNLAIILVFLSTFRAGIVISILFKPYFYLFSLIDLGIHNDISIWWVLISTLATILVFPDSRVRHWPVKKGLIRKANLILILPVWWWIFA